MTTLPPGVLLSGTRFRWFASAGALGLAGLGEGLDPWRQLKRRWAHLTGALDHSRFAFVTKTLTRYPRAGNFSPWRPWRSVRHPEPGVMVNAVSLTNPGLETWIDRYYPLTVRRELNVVVSVAPSTPLEAADMANVIASRAPQVLALEANLSCPNAPHADQYRKLQIAEALTSRLPTILKIGVDDDPFYLDQCKPVAVHLVNAAPWSRLYPGDTSPLAGYGYEGSVSGKPVAELADSRLQDYARERLEAKIISGGGILDASEVRKRFYHLALAVSMWTAFDVDAGLPNRIIEEVEGRS